MCTDTARCSPTYRKEQSQRPHQSKTPRGAKNRKNSQKTEQTPWGRHDFFVFSEKRPGAFFFALFREEGFVGRAHDTKRCAKRTCCQSGKGRFAACNGRNCRGIFVSLRIYSSIQVFFLLLCLDQWTQPYQANIFFLSGNAPGGAFCPTR